jgi:hypothetical protein
MKDAKIQRQHDGDENVEQNPNRYLVHALSKLLMGLDYGLEMKTAESESGYR